MGPGLTLIFTVAVITTCKSDPRLKMDFAEDKGSDYVIGIFKRNHPEVYTVAEYVAGSLIVAMNAL
jgi:hypothetical protein